MEGNTLYIFLDEAGNFDCSLTGTSYFTFSAFSIRRPFGGIDELTNLKYDLWEKGLEVECFHVAEDRQAVRDRVFGILGRRLPECRVDCQIVEKRKTNLVLQKDHERFYHTILEILLMYVLKQQSDAVSKVIVVADQIPVKKRRREIEKATKLTMAGWSRKSGIPYSVMFHSSKSDLNLQIADYLNWAVFRKWERGDGRSYDLVATFIKSEFETFNRGNDIYY